ncbi:hypothetical protein IFU23_05760 [Pantoea agglomerans]|uniref:Uncharacterized protein n=1 Tax=Enterobacter agglomerans TaxID=549 RepID=A0ACC5PW62_ENTAG|nr:hypothetical protein [Pantoea agglomerans]MBD8152273.1 hypothetical protein [Pantoea agglomerans]MBD8157612.1 hypothetical protein [Pantoea agglomerans]MBD8231451.1 hypothetical protein [Pantoea agglomerans]MBD8241856.1 hypothetical protein [Pantoea agglomerans]
MPNLKMMLCVASLPLVLAGCMSMQNVPCPVPAQRQAPSAWAMEPPSNSLQILDETFSTSAPASSAIRKS